MLDRLLPAHLDDGQGDAGPAIDRRALDPEHQEGFAASDGDGTMLGRVLIYAGAITVIVVAIVWKRFA